MRRSLALAATVWMLALPSAARAQTAAPLGPPGWRTEVRDQVIMAVPPGLEEGEIFLLGLQTGIEAPEGPLRRWFQRVVDVKTRPMGKLVEDGGIQPHKKGGLITGRRYRSADGKNLVATFVIRPNKNGTYFLVMIVCTEDSCRAHVPGAKQWMEAFAERAASLATDGTQREPAETPAEPPPPPRPEPRPDYQTEPNRGLKPAEIEQMTTLFEMSPLSGASMDLILLLKNGEFCTNVNLPPSDMNVAAHKKQFPGYWGKWRRRGGKFQILDDDGTWIDTKWSGALEPGRPGEKLKGTFERMGGGGGMIGSTTVVSSSHITFLPDGRFRYGRFGGVWTAGAGSGPATAHASSSSERQGTYRIEGRTIEFRFSDGTVDRRAFHWVDHKDKDAIFLNETFYFIDN